jgi:hypothetical protein
MNYAITHGHRYQQVDAYTKVAPFSQNRVDSYMSSDKITRKSATDKFVTLAKYCHDKDIP